MGTGIRPTRHNVCALALVCGSILAAVFLGSGTTGETAPADATTASDSLANKRVLPGIARDAAAAASPTPTQPPPPSQGGQSSYGLIEDARRKGTISGETALLYGVFADFGDQRLPAQYRGVPARAPEFDYLRRAAMLHGTLSPSGQSILQPFLLPPAAAGSWLNLASGQVTAQAVQWESFTSAGGNVRVWWQTSYPQGMYDAWMIADAVSDEIWPTITGLMGREPPSDAGELRSGGDGKYDIYLVSSSQLRPEFRDVYGYVTPWGCPPTASYMVVNQDKGRYLLPTIAHEFMHSVQFAFKAPCADTDVDWLMESTATWAEDFVYPTDQSEQEYGADIWNEDKYHLPLETYELGAARRQYGSYIFPFFLTRTKAPDIIRTIWEAVDGRSALEAVDVSIGTFEQEWPKFGAYSWNPIFEPPIDYYYQWDSVGAGGSFIGLGEEVDLQGQDQVIFDKIAKDGVTHLSLVYDYFRFTDASATSIGFFNGYTYKLELKDLGEGIFGYVASELSAEEKKGRKVKAHIRMKGDTWKTEDWSERPVVTYCRDKADERIEQLVLVFTYSEFEDKSKIARPEALNPTLLASNYGCWRWEGNVTFTSGDGLRSASAQVTFQRAAVHDQAGVVASGASDEYRALGLSYDALSGGTLSVVISGTDELDCQHSGNYSGAVEIGPASTLLITFNLVPTGAWYRSYAGFGASLNTFIETIRCPEDDPVTLPTFVAGWFATGDPFQQQVSADGSRIQGHFEDDDGSRFEWNFVSVPEP